MTYQEIKKIVEERGFVFFDKGKYNLNVVAFRYGLDATNHFNDVLRVAYRDEQLKEQVLELKWTTKPGLKGSLYNPVTVAGITGTAWIKEGQYRSVYEFRDTDKEFSSHPYYRQIGLMDYYRDGNKDNKLDKVNEQDDRIFGTHLHRMSNFGDKRFIENYEINNWSLGCNGSVLTEFDKLIELQREAIKNGQGNKISYTIIEIL